MKHLAQILCIPLVFIVGWLSRDWQQSPPVPTVESSISELVSHPVSAVERSKFIELVQIIAPLGDPDKLATLKAESAAPDRLYEAKALGIDPSELLTACIEKWGWNGTERGRLTKSAILSALAELESYSCFELAEDRDRLRKGKHPTVRKGYHAGEMIHIDHIVPKAEAKELSQVLTNLRPVPQSTNQRKGAELGETSINHWNALKVSGLARGL